MSQEMLKKWQSQLRKGTLELCVLGLIAQGDSYAFAMLQALQAAGQEISEGALYPLLKRLQKDGLISSYWRESDSGPPRKYYQLTPVGQQVLKLMHAEWQSFQAFMQTILKGVSDVHPPSHTSPPAETISFQVGPPPGNPSTR